MSKIFVKNIDFLTSKQTSKQIPSVNHFQDTNNKTSLFISNGKWSFYIEYSLEIIRYSVHCGYCKPPFWEKS